MRLDVWMIAAGSAIAASLPAFGQSYVGTPLSPPALQAAIVDAVASRLLDPHAAHIRDLTLSRARNGRGYCGTVSVDGTAAYQPFHVIAEEDGSYAVLILPEKGDPPGLSRADAMRLLTALGCLP